MRLNIRPRREFSERDFAGAPEIKDGAVFLADAHFNPIGRKDILRFFWAVAKGEIEAKQLFLLGDIADCLFGYFKFSRERNREIVEAIDAAAASGAEIWYFEGNHDFTLEKTFSRGVKIIKRSDQPAPFVFRGQKTLLLHGDYAIGLGYELYSAVVRNKFALFCANILLLNFCGNWVLKYVENMLAKKRLDYEIEDYEVNRAKKISDLLNCADIVIEGHFHQNRGFRAARAEYQNIPAFALKTSYIRLEWLQKRAVFKNGSL